MKKDKENNRPRGDGLILFALLLLINPSVQVVDIFPDFIAYIIILRRLSYAVDRAPYFAEARSAVSKLLLISILKLPAYFVIVFARSGNVGDTDIYALFAFSFAAVEAIFSVIAIYYLFEGAFYLGQRTEAISLIKPFTINKRGTRTRSPESLRALAYFFAVYKCAAYGLPELLLLTKTVTEEQLKNYFNITSLYPYTILFAIVSVIIIGVLLLRRAYAYIKQAENATSLTAALDSLVSGEARIRLENKARVKEISLLLGIITLSSLFMLEIRLDNFSLANISPHFFMGIILLFAAHKMKSLVGKCKALTATLWVFIAVSAVEWVMEANFLSEYSFSLLASSGLVKREFMPILAVSLLEVAVFAVVMILLGFKLIKLQRSHALRASESLPRSKKLYTVGFSALAILVSVMRYVNLLLRYFAKNTTVSFENSDGMISTGVVTEPLLPWFNVVVIAATLFLAFYSYYFFASVKEEVEIRYS